MNRYLTPLVIAVVAFASIAAAESAGLLERAEEARRHEQKTFAGQAAVPAEAVGPTACLPKAAGEGAATGQAGVFPCKGVDLLSFTPAADVAGVMAPAETIDTGLSDIWGWTDATTGDEYVIVGKTHGVGFFRVTDPTEPEYLGEVPSGSAAQLIWYDIKVFRDHAFIVSESNHHGMKVFDLTRLRDLDGSEPQTLAPDAVYPLPVAAHNLAINEDTGYAYIVGGNAGLAVQDQCLAGLHMVDISNPKTPLFAGCYVGDGGPGVAGSLVGPVGELSRYVHDTQCVLYDGPDSRYRGRELCFNSSETHLSVVDVTDKLAPVQVGTVDYDNVAYTHQGWLTDDHATFLLGDEGDERATGDPTRTLIFDVSDLENPGLAGEHFHATTAIDHNMYVRGPLVFQSNYRAGLRILDLEHVADGRLEEVAFFDVYPDDDAAEFDGTWSNYPYFASGTIAVSSYDGLFLLEVDRGIWTRYYGPSDGPGSPSE